MRIAILTNEYPPHIYGGAGHVDLYDRLNYVPFDKLTSFFTEYLKERYARNHLPHDAMVF